MGRYNTTHMDFGILHEDIGRANEKCLFRRTSNGVGSQYIAILVDRKFPGLRILNIPVAVNDVIGLEMKEQLFEPRHKEGA